MAKLNQQDKRLSIWQPIMPESIYLDEYTNVVATASKEKDVKQRGFTRRIKGGEGFHAKVSTEELEQEIRRGNKILVRLMILSFVTLNIALIALLSQDYDLSQFADGNAITRLYYSTKSAFFRNVSEFQDFAHHSMMPESFWRD